MDADTWAKVIAVQYNLDDAVIFSGVDVAKAFQYGNGKIIHQQMELEAGYRYDDTNNKTIIFKRQHRQHGQNQKKSNYYYAAPAGYRFSGENANNKWFFNISYAEDLLNEKKTRGNTLHFSSDIEMVEILNEKETTTGKRKRFQPQILSNSLDAKSIEMAVSQNPLSTPEVSSLEEDPQCPPVVNHFWFSKEAMALFRPVDDESVLDAINNQIKVLEQVNKGDTEYIDVIENLNQMNLSEISTHQVFCLRQKCLYLVLALKLAKQHMRNWRWQKCVEEASKELENIGIVLSRNARTVMGWYNSFRVKRKFTLPVPKKELPPFLQQNPELCTTIKEYCRENLGDLSIEFLFQYLHKTTLPQLVEAETKVRKDDMEEEEYQKELRRILKPYRLVTVCMSTVQRWLHLLGFKYELRKKSYYVDGHEKPATIQYRHDFCKRYLGYEQRMHRWVQITEEEAETLESQNKIPEGSGYHYTCPLTGQRMVEFHVDTSEALLKLAKISNSFGGNLSVRFPPGMKPLIIFGQDECIFKQFLMTKKNMDRAER
jgi:hypothetical protein